MQIILVHPRLTKARSVTLKPHYLVGLAVFFVVSVIAAGYALLLVLSSYFPYLALRAGIASTPGGKRDAGPGPIRTRKYCHHGSQGRRDASAYHAARCARRAGEGSWLAFPRKPSVSERSGRGGTAPAEAAGPSNGNLTMADFRLELERLAAAIESRTDYLNVVETALTREKVQFKALPTVQPVRLSYNASGFGWRIDPINGRQAFHEGIVFPASRPSCCGSGGRCRNRSEISSSVRQ